MRSPRSDNPVGFVDPACPIEWGHQLNRGLVGDWTILPNSGWRGGVTFRDIVRGGHNPNDGVFTGNVAWTGGRSIPGSYGALSLNGSSTYASLGSSSILAPPAMTITAWVNSPSFSNSYNVVISRVQIGTGNYQLFVKSTGKLAVYFFATDGRNYDGTGAYTLSTNTPYHLAVTYDSVNGLVGYVNGQVDATVSANGSLAATSTATYIGQDSATAGRVWNGLINGAQIFNRALPAGQIYQLYQEQKKGRPDTLRWYGRKTYSIPPIAIAPAKVARQVGSTQVKRFVDPMCPIEWSHPLNRGLVFDTTILPNSGWMGGNSLRDIVRGGHYARDLVNTSATWIGGAGRRALHYDGSAGYSHLDSVPPGNFQDNTAWSIVFWFRGATNSSLFGTYNGYNNGNQGWIVEIGGVASAGAIGMDLINNDASLQRRAYSDKSVIDGKWHHCVCTYTGSQDYTGFSFYVDGVKGATNPSPGQNNAPGTLANNTLWLGRWAFGYAAFDLAGTQFYTRVLTNSQVAQLYQEQRPGRPETLRWYGGKSGLAFFGAAAAASIYLPYDIVHSPSHQSMVAR